MYPSWASFASLFQLWAKCFSFAFPSLSFAFPSPSFAPFHSFIVFLPSDLHSSVQVLHPSVPLLCQTFQLGTPLVPVLHSLVPVLFFLVPVVQSRFNSAACLFQLYISPVPVLRPSCSHYVTSLSHICSQRGRFTHSLFLLCPVMYTTMFQSCNLSHFQLNVIGQNTKCWRAGNVTYKFFSRDHLVFIFYDYLFTHLHKRPKLDIPPHHPSHISLQPRPLVHNHNFFIVPRAPPLPIIHTSSSSSNPTLIFTHLFTTPHNFLP